MFIAYCSEDISILYKNHLTTALPENTEKH